MHISFFLRASEASVFGSADGRMLAQKKWKVSAPSGNDDKE